MIWEPAYQEKSNIFLNYSEAVQNWSWGFLYWIFVFNCFFYFINYTLELENARIDCAFKSDKLLLLQQDELMLTNKNMIEHVIEILQVIKR